MIWRRNQLPRGVWSSTAAMVCPFSSRTHGPFASAFGSPSSTSTIQPKGPAHWVGPFFFACDFGFASCRSSLYISVRPCAPSPRCGSLSRPCSCWRLVTGFSADSNAKISSRVCGSGPSCFWHTRFRPRACSTRRLKIRVRHGLGRRIEKQKLKIETTLMAVGVVLHVNFVVHGGGSGVRFLVGVDRCDVLQACADVVEAFEQNFLAGRGDFEFEHQAVFVRDGLIRQIHRKRIAFFLFRALEELFDLFLGKRGRQDAVLKAVVVENVGVARRDDHTEAVVLHTPRGVFAAGAAAKVRTRKQNRCVLVTRKIQDEFGIWFFAGQITPVVKEDAAEAFARERF